MPVRVLWVVKGLGPGGAENLLAGAADLHDRNRFEIHCAFVLPHKDHLVARLEKAGVRTWCVGTGQREVGWPLRLARLVRSGRYDVLHVHSPLPGSVARLAARTMPRHSRPRIVATEHNAWGTFTPLTRTFNRLTARWNDATFAVSEEARASITGRAAEHAVALTHGIDLDRTRAFRADRDAVRAELGLAPDEIVIGTVANFRPQKDHPTLLRAARSLLDLGVVARWVVVGQGPLEEATRTLAHDLGLDDAVTFTGFRADATRLMSSFDVFTLASSWEGLPVALMDALALGLPVVSTEVGGIAETMRDGTDALLVPPGEPLALAEAWRRVITDRALRAALAAASSERSKEFDAHVAVTRIESTYAELAPRSASTATTPPPTAKPRSAGGYEIRPATEEDRADILALLRRSMHREDDPRFAELYEWKHDRNPFGPSPTWVATSNGRVAGVRVFMRWEFERGGEVIRAVRAVDTATDPEHQGKGLFTALTMHSLDALADDGVAFVFNTPNAQSLPGYLKMGWREVGHLPVAVHLGGPLSALRTLRARVAADHWSQPITIGISLAEWVEGRESWRRQPVSHVRTLSTNATGDFDRWRFGGLAELHYRVVPHPTVADAAVVVRARRRGPALELVHLATFGLTEHDADDLVARTARQVGADHAIRLGHAALRTRWVPMPGGGPLLTWRDLLDAGQPPLANWVLTMADVELF